jgi:Chaperone of endosialidase
MNPLTQSKNTTVLPVLIALTLACFGLSPAARAVCQEDCLTSNNTVLGDDALLNNTTGFDNTAIGFNALSSNTTGANNMAIGSQALFSNTTGDNNTANGAFALFSNTTGSFNIALGFLAGASLTTGNNNIDIGNGGVPGDSNTIRIGTSGAQKRTFIAGISGATVPGGVGVIVGNNGKLGTVVSSERFKDDIKPMDKASEAILALKPVTFRYKHELDPDCVPQFGLVAEQVEKVSPALVARDNQGKPYTVRYEAVNAMLLNEFLKEHRKNEKQESKIEQQEAKIARQQKQIDALTAGLQKVSAQLEASKTASQIVLNNQ